MGLNKDAGNANGNFVAVKHGGLCLESNTPRDGYEEITVHNPKTDQDQQKWIMKFGSLDGMVRSIDWYDTNDEYDTRFMGIKIKIEDDGENFILDLPFAKRAYDAFAKFVENIDFTKPVEFVAWYDRKKDATGFAAKQDGQIVRQKYTKDNMGDCPEAVESKRTGKWNFDEQREWLLDNVVMKAAEVVAKLNQSPEPDYEEPVKHAEPKPKAKRSKAAAADAGDRWKDVEEAF